MSGLKEMASVNLLLIKKKKLYLKHPLFVFKNKTLLVRSFGILSEAPLPYPEGYTDT